jgi:predicted amidohydrolase YtcJ
MTTIFKGARLFSSTAEDLDKPGTTSGSFHNCMVIKDDVIVHVGQESDAVVQEARKAGATEIDLEMHLVVPGFIDSHTHISQFGWSLVKVALQYCRNLDEIRATIKDYAVKHPSAPRILCRGWTQDSTNGIALASMLDDLDPRPIFIEANDCHSSWCNTAALKAMNVDSMADPPGGQIFRDENGKPSGLLSENAHFEILWPYLSSLTTPQEKADVIARALSTYATAGYTGLVDMAMDETDWELLQLLRSQGRLHCRIAAHWIIMPKGSEAENLAQVDRAIALHKQFNAETSPHFRIAGIKLICDGVIDSCTASLLMPYSCNGSSCDPIWTADILEPVVKRADSAGLQCAFHAIGDNTVRTVIDTIEKFGSPGRRHRIEHMELTTAEDAKRLGKLGITASVQPVHSDPAILKAWPKLIGEDRCKRTFAYKDFADGGAPLCIGSDAPTAPHSALENVYIATTRRSAKVPEMTDTTNKNFALSLAAALSAATSGAAYSYFAEKWTGQLKAGYKADFTVLDAQWVPETFLKARVLQTWFDGKKLFDAQG